MSLQALICIMDQYSRTFIALTNGTYVLKNKIVLGGGVRVLLMPVGTGAFPIHDTIREKP